jgi:chitinase
MYWDASQAYGNNRFDQAIKAAIKTDGGSAPAPPQPTDSAPAAPTDSAPAAPSAPTAPTDSAPAAPAPSSGSGAGSCATAKAWSATQVYTGGQSATADGKLWTAQWWTQNEKPGPAGGVWKQAGSCGGQRRSRLFRY